VRFIPAKEHPFYLWFFYHITRLLFALRFHRVIIHNEYEPRRADCSIFYCNHNYWWDPLIPHYLNTRFFKQKARGMMDLRQVLKHSFFPKIGVFSVDLEHQRNVITSLRYAVDHLENPNASLYLFPEGTIVPVDSKPMNFKPGLAWIQKRSPKADVIPIAIYIDYSKASKPNLHIHIGKKLSDKKDFQAPLHTLLSQIKADVHTS
jgi:1-acyl-sn-glycerol-3-phosphate acyltransferase